ncbi:transmembrane protein 154 isoform X2 [Scleropages formosus]|uniref:transmembrane protein 154 isoform X2 n=1 Tax=Scleropages formosus TaxID=113540 RepID=UPI0010FA89C7|nr:transmembrane protein 154 isoform X2 [Scleropages formosus]
MPASGEAEGQLKALDMTLPPRPWLLLPPLLLLLLTAAPLGRVYGDELTTQDTLVGYGVDHSGTSEAVTEAVTISTWSSGTVDPEDSSQDVTQARGDAHETLLGPTESPTEHPEDDQADSLVVMVAIPLVLLVLIALVVTGFFICRRRKASSFRDGREDQFLAGSNEEKVPMPMFEDDVPSVLELEMEDLEKWIVKDSGGAVQDPGKEK